MKTFNGYIKTFYETQKITLKAIITKKFYNPITMIDSIAKLIIQI